MDLDLNTEFGARVERRLREERVIWLTTVRRDLTPQPSLVWFLWDAGTLLIYSKPNTPKLRNIEQSPTVALNFDSDGQGGNMVICTGTAIIDRQAPSLDQVAAYAEKYAPNIAGMNLTPVSFGQVYSVPIRVTPARLRGH
ncbi:MAG: TIGR03667 family PPOX class F420-dependent oxidoreductase [Roseiflexaceae bacterium]